MIETSPRPALVQAVQTAKARVQEARALDAGDIRRAEETALSTVQKGKLLIAAKAEVKAAGGSWLEFLRETWPTLNPRTAQHWMRAAKYETLSYLAGRLVEATRGGDAALTDEELEEWDPADPTPDRGDADEEEEEPRKPAGKGKEKPAGGKPAVQKELELEPDVAEAKATVAELKDLGDAYRERIRQALAGRAADEFKKQFRLSGVQVREDGTVPVFETVHRLVTKVAQQGFE